MQPLQQQLNQFERTHAEFANRTGLVGQARIAHGAAVAERVGGPLAEQVLGAGHLELSQQGGARDPRGAAQFGLDLIVVFERVTAVAVPVVTQRTSRWRICRVEAAVVAGCRTAARPAAKRGVAVGQLQGLQLQLEGVVRLVPPVLLHAPGVVVEPGEAGFQLGLERAKALAGFEGAARGAQARGQQHQHDERVRAFVDGLAASLSSFLRALGSCLQRRPRSD